MNILTKNRILQKGDEYRDNGTWHPVSKDNYGLQVLFTPYKECRRPSEKPQVLRPITSSPRPIGPSNDSRPVPTARKAQTSEGVKRSPSAAPSKDAASGGETTLQTGDASYLPTVVSPKAHQTIDKERQRETARSIHKQVETLRETPETAKDAPTEVAKSPVSPTPSGTSTTLPSKAVEIAWPYDLDTKWIGRNGTFNNRGLNLHVREELMGSIIQIVPVGKRGTAKNALIEFPTSAVPMVVRYLEEKYREATK